MRENRRLKRRMAERQRRKDEIKDALVEASFKSGLPQVTVESVAELAGFSKAAIYYYFEDKDRIIAEIVSDAWKGWHEGFASTGDSVMTAREEIVKALTAMSLKHLVNFKRNQFAFGLYFNGFYPRKYEQQWKGLEKSLAQRIRRIAKRGLEDGSLAGRDPEELLNLVGVAVNTCLNGLVARVGVEKVREEEVREIVEDVVGRLCAPL